MQPTQDEVVKAAAEEAASTAAARRAWAEAASDSLAIENSRACRSAAAFARVPRDDVGTGREARVKRSMCLRPMAGCNDSHAANCTASCFALADSSHPRPFRCDKAPLL